MNVCSVLRQCEFCAQILAHLLYSIPNPSAIELAKAAGLKEACEEFVKLVSMGTEEGIRFYNEHCDHISKQSNFSPVRSPIPLIEFLHGDIARKYESHLAAGESPTCSGPTGGSQTCNPSQKRTKVCF
jgi:hypothetical protein